jgi:hypothetical protein
MQMKSRKLNKIQYVPLYCFFSCFKSFRYTITKVIMKAITKNNAKYNCPVENIMIFFLQK